jgi:hypothetical protein
MPKPYSQLRAQMSPEAQARAAAKAAAMEATMPDATLAALLDRLEALCAFVGYDPASHAPLDEIVTIEERLRMIDGSVELMQGQLDEVLALLRAMQAGR